MSEVPVLEPGDPDVARARSGDHEAFTRLVEPLRREVHAHCYRMLGSVHDADDALQEALLRAWRGFGRFEGRSSVRNWLYAISTNACLDVVERRGRRALPVDLGPASTEVGEHVPRTDVAWLGPYPDARYEQREAVELAFVAALQHLPGNQRAALLLFEVLGFTAAEIADVMKTTVTSVNSALARARRVLTAKVGGPAGLPALSKVQDARVREVVAGYTAALERGDADAFVALLTEDVTWSMPPMPHWYRGRESVMDFVSRVPMTTCGAWRHVVTSANGQPAVACYLRREGEDRHDAWSITVLTLRDGLIAELTSFIGDDHFKLFALPLSLPATS
ncbi:sigma-70 family RNA polymerase sigma factor [Saccharothrix variisporea]|uniref:sigma-70 family RNA polymerase sigma factor n=1 Tax=Saccharothrix variisporea TaxID=543527 RepID=UPI000EAB6654|nr:sigma-70 family RNA polymerase sigma factor [Saccharothrix variisporea]